MIVGAYPEVAFGGFTRVDGSIAFYTRVAALLPSAGRVLDVGCGRGAAADDPVEYRRRLRTLRGRGPHVVGIDVDRAAAGNPLLDEFRWIESPERWPAQDREFDLLVCDYVVEHVGNPESFFAECARVVRPGGFACLRTPNLLGYVSVVSSLVPNRWHAGVTGYAQKSRRQEDVFPTVYRCNTRGKLRRALRRAGFDACVLTHEAEPGYLAFSSAALRTGAFLHRLIPGPFQANLFAFARRLDVSDRAS